jgi:hypothetical protein
MDEDVGRSRLVVKNVCRERQHCTVDIAYPVNRFEKNLCREMKRPNTESFAKSLVEDQ